MIRTTPATDLATDMSAMCDSLIYKPLVLRHGAGRRHHGHGHQVAAGEGGHGVQQQEHCIRPGQSDVSDVGPDNETCCLCQKWIDA